MDIWPTWPMCLGKEARPCHLGSVQETMCTAKQQQNFSDDTAICCCVMLFMFFPLSYFHFAFRYKSPTLYHPVCGGSNWYHHGQYWRCPKNSAPLNHQILVGFFIINQPFWDASILGNHHIHIGPSYLFDLSSFADVGAHHLGHEQQEPISLRTGTLSSQADTVQLRTEWFPVCVKIMFKNPLPRPLL